MFTGPTRVTDSTSSHLDVFLANCCYSFVDVTTVLVGFSDHHVVMGTYLAQQSHPPSGHKFINVRSYRRLDPTLLNDIYTDGEVWMMYFLLTISLTLLIVLLLYYRAFWTFCSIA